MAQDACATLEAAGDDWGAAASSLIRATGAARAGDVATVAAMAAAVRRHSDAIEYDAFRVPGLLLEAWVAERRQRRRGRSGWIPARARARGAHRVRRPRGVRALRDSGRTRSRTATCARPRSSSGRRSRPPRRPEATWVAAHARVQLARIAAATGDADGAERLYRQVLEWSQLQRPHQARESLFVALAGSPATAALLGLAELAEARGDTAAADEFRGARGPRAHLSWQNRRRAWQSVGIGGREPSCCQRQTNRRLDMSTTTIEDQLAEVRRRIDRLQALAQAGVTAERARIRRHLDALHQEEASVRAAVRQAPDEVEEKLGQLKTRLAVAEHSLAADVSDDWATFAAAVEAELRSWDTYLERLQTSVAAKAWKAREQAEAAIGDVRSRRIAVGERLAQVRDSAGAASQEARKHITAARDELEQKAAELSTKLN